MRAIYINKDGWERPSALLEFAIGLIQTETKVLQGKK